MKKNSNKDNIDKILTFPNQSINQTNNKETNNNSDETNLSKKSRDNNLRRGILYGIFIIFFLCVILFIIQDNSFNATNTVNTDPINLVGAHNYDFAKYREGYIIAKDGRISCYNTNQELQWEVNGSKTAPKVKTNGKYCLTYYSDAKLAVTTNGKTTNRIKTSGNIQYGYINQKGGTVLFVDEAGLKNKIIVYNKDGKQIYYRQNSDSHIPIAVLSDNNYDLITVETNSDSRNFYSEVKVFDIRNKDKIKANIKVEKNVIGGCFFYKKNEFIVVAENAIKAYTTDGKEKWNVDLSDRKISRYSYNNNDIIGLIFNDDDSANSGSEIAFYNIKGKKISSYKTEKKVYDIDICAKTAMIRMDREIVILNTKGKYISSYDIAFDIKESIFLSTRKCILVLSNSDEIKLLKTE